jgi:hypothetical protein
LEMGLVGRLVGTAKDKPGNIALIAMTIAAALGSGLITSN